MNELTYSFIGSLRAWLRENESMLELHRIKVEIPVYDLDYSANAYFTSARFVAGFYVWEKRGRSVAMSDVEFADLRIARQDSEHQIESAHYEYARIDEMRDALDVLRDRLLAVPQDE